MNRNTVWRSLVVLASLVTIAVNGLANALPLNGLNTGEISDRFHIYFVPAGYVFSIWGLIYLGLLAYSVYQFLPSQRDDPSLDRIAGLYVLSSAFNIAWLFLWHYEQFIFTIFMMLGLLLSLIAIYLSLGIGQRLASSAMRWFVHLPFSIYLGWVSVATIANASQLFDYLGWQGGGISPQIWTIFMLAVAILICAALAIMRNDAGFVLVLVWAFAGIGIKQADAPAVATAAWIATGVAALLTVLAAWRARNAQTGVPV
jgi:benzodiazapine receptor